MYENLVFWLKSELHDIVETMIDKSKISSGDRYFTLFESKKAKIIRDYDFTELTIPKQFLEFTESQKESIRELMSVWSDNIFFEDYLRLICRVGYCYEKAGLESSPEYRAVLANYAFLKELWSNIYPDEFNQFEFEKRGCVIEATKPQQQLRPSCIECGSSDVISREPNWHCKSCGRQWLKKPRRQNLTINQP